MQSVSQSYHDQDVEQDLDQPMSDVTLDRNFSGRLRCKTLVVAAGVTVSGVVKADAIYIHGELKGIARGQDVIVAEKGVLLGQVQCESLKLGGRAIGLLHARQIIARGSAVMEGEILSDSLKRQETTLVKAYTSVGPGCFQRPDLLEAARNRIASVTRGRAQALDTNVLSLQPTPQELEMEIPADDAVPQSRHSASEDVVPASSSRPAPDSMPAPSGRRVPSLL